MRKADRLLALSSYRNLLRRAGLATPGAPKNTANHPPLGGCAPAISHLITARDADVIAALFVPLAWSAGGDDTHPGVVVITIRWNLDDPNGERLAWIALRAALRAKRSRS